jgi:hypothetical protein
MRNLNFELTKRHKIIFTSAVAILGFLIITHTVNIIFRRYYLIFILAFVTYLLSLWSLWKGMTKTKAIVLFILPVFYTLAIPLFYFLFKDIRWLTRLPAAIFFGLSFYCLLLAQNVFNVASDRTIPLYRAASAVNFVYTIFTIILINSLIFAFNLPFYWNGLLILLVNFPLILQSLWTVKIERINAQIVIYSFVAALLLAEAAIALSFWSLSPFIRSLSLSTLNYVILGILLDYLHERVNRRIVLEYVGVGVGVWLFIAIFSLYTQV